MSSSSILFINGCHGCIVIFLSAAEAKMLSEWVSQSVFIVLVQGAKHKSLMVSTSCVFHKSDLYCCIYSYCIDLQQSTECRVQP